MSPRLPRGAAATFFLALAALGIAAVATPAGCAQETPCRFNSDCVPGYCVNGVCKQDCADSARDCPPGYVCDANAQCTPASTGSGGAGSTTSTSGAGAATSTSGTGAATSTGTGPGTTTTTVTSTGTSTSTVTTTSTSSTGGTMHGHELDLCASDGDCAAPLVCRAMSQGGQKRCTRTCASTAACMTGTVCESIGGTMYCADDDTGKPCSAAQECNFGCLTSQQYCTVACNTGADCPNGYGCAGVGTPPVRVCVKAEAPCDQSDTSACIAAAACDLSPQMVVGGCTLACSSVLDCPVRATGFSPWSCDSGGICRRPADVFGPLPTGATPAQYACNASGTPVNVCNDAQHIDYMAFDVPQAPAVSCAATMTTPGIATDSCVDSCRYQGGCPFGFACVALGSVDNGQSRVGLCLPTGGGEVGAPCTWPGECAFGYCLGTGTCSRDCTHDGVCPTGSTCVAGGGPAVEGEPFRRCE